MTPSRAGLGGHRRIYEGTRRCGRVHQEALLGCGELKRIAADIRPAQSEARSIEPLIRRAVGDAFDTYAGELISHQDAFLARVDKILVDQTQSRPPRAWPGVPPAWLWWERRPPSRGRTPCRPHSRGRGTRQPPWDAWFRPGDTPPPPVRPPAVPRRRTPGSSRLSAESGTRLGELLRTIVALLDKSDSTSALAVIPRTTGPLSPDSLGIELPSVAR